MHNCYVKVSLLFALHAVLFSLSSCKKGWLDVNYDPTRLADESVTPDLQLPNLLLSLPGEYESLQRWMGYWCIPPIVPAGVEEQTYNIRPSSKEFISQFHLGGEVMGQIIAMESKAIQSRQSFYEGIAKTLLVLNWSRAVDQQDKVPYSEAFRENIRTPRYDDGQLIYEDLMIQLDKAIDLIRSADIGQNIRIGVADIMFHGNKQKWIKFINTIKLRLLVHQANRPERATYIQNQIARILNEGADFLGSNEDAAVNPGFSLNKPNPFYLKYQYLKSEWLQFGDRTMGQHFSYEFAAANEFALNLYKQNDDPRIGYFYNTVKMMVPPGSAEPFPQSAPHNYRGNRFGLVVDPSIYPYQGLNYISLMGGTATFGPVSNTSYGLLKGYDMDSWVLTSVESLFLQAEAIFRGWLPGNAEAAYKDAVKESFRWLNVGRDRNNPALSDAAFESWYQNQVSAGNERVSWNHAQDKYKLLMLQKYLALNGIDAFETWIDYRRNGQFPNLPLSADPGCISSVIPVRLPITISEYENNAANVIALGPIDIFTGKIWWMP